MVPTVQRRAVAPCGARVERFFFFGRPSISRACHVSADLTHVMKRWPVYSAGFDYNMLAILGPQSSGKSTLLNGLFGTTFPTMQSQEGRYQCTKGIWLGRSAHSNTLVMDVEGTDGRERGEAEVAFEKKTSLFSLALAEVLIVNMWMQDVGRNNAANLPLLKTVFDINLQLFQKEKRSKTMLLFIVRDHVSFFFKSSAKNTPLSRGAGAPTNAFEQAGRHH